MIVRLHWLRAWRSRRPVLALASLAFFLVLMLVGFYTYAQTETGGDAEFRYTFENSSYFNGLTFALYAFYFAFLLLLPLFVAIEASAQVAGDTASGALRLLLTRPLSRSQIFFTKALFAFLLSLALTGAFLALALGIGLVAVGWGDLDLYPGVLQMTSSHQHLPQSDALLRFVLVWPAATLALFAPLCLSLLVAAWSRSTVNAVGVSVSLYLILYVVSEIHFFDALRPWLFTSHATYWRALFQEHIEWPRLLLDASKLLGFSFVFLALGFHRFRRREEA